MWAFHLVSLTNYWFFLETGEVDFLENQDFFKCHFWWNPVSLKNAPEFFKYIGKIRKDRFSCSRDISLLYWEIDSRTHWWRWTKWVSNTTQVCFQINQRIILTSAQRCLVPKPKFNSVIILNMLLSNYHFSVGL